MTTDFRPQWPFFTQEEADRVQHVLLSNRVNYWTGQEGRQFEKEFAAFSDCGYAVAITNGTVALEIAWRALGIGKGDEVIVTPRSFIASVSTVAMTGATPIFADVDRDSQNLTADTIAPMITPRTKAILCVHLAGWPCEMDKINELAKAHGLSVVEDCAQAHGATFRGKPVGALGDIGVWSFCQDKIMTTGGEGGMITTSDQALWSTMWSYKDHGKSWEAVNNPNPKPGFQWLHESFGTNGRMTEMQSALGRIQLARMPEWSAARKKNAEAIQAVATTCPALRTPTVPDHIGHAWYKYYVFVRPDALKSNWSRRRILTEILGEGVPCFTGSCGEIYLEKAFDHTGFRPAKRLPGAMDLGETSLMFEVHPTLRSVDIDQLCNAIKTVMARATR